MILKICYDEEVIHVILISMIWQSCHGKYFERDKFVFLLLNVAYIVTILLRAN